MEMISANFTYTALLVVQALHLLHHRLAKRHISFVEVFTGGVLCIPPGTLLPTTILVFLHAALIAIQIFGSLFIYRLSPNWDN